MGRSWHQRERDRRETAAANPTSPINRLMAIIEARMETMTDDAIETASHAAARVVHQARKRRGRDRAWLRAALTTVAPASPRSGATSEGASS